MKVYHQWFPDLRIQLAAPTGKAAKRMNESIDTGLLELYGEAMTIHRMLEPGMMAASPRVSRIDLIRYYYNR